MSTSIMFISVVLARIRLFCFSRKIIFFYHLVSNVDKCKSLVCHATGARSLTAKALLLIIAPSFKRIAVGWSF